MAVVPSQRRPIILTFNRTYVPGYRGGGPIRTIANMVEQLGDHFEFRVVTQDRDAGAHEPYAGIVPETWTPSGKGFVYYMGPARITTRSLARLVRTETHDLLYLNSFFDRVFTAKVLLARALGLLGPGPIVLAPRGEFSPGALQYKWLKKQAYLCGFRMSGSSDDIVWQASTPLENAAIRRVLPRVKQSNIMVACDLASAQPGLDDFSAATHDGPLRVLFLSRISPMKNLVFVLQVLASVKCPVALSIVGPRDEDYWRDCQPALRALPPHVTVDVHDCVPPDAVTDVMRRHDLFFLPTQGENFGHVIHEALSVGLPVLISDRTPWTGVSAAGAGWAFPLDAHEPFITTVDHYASTPWQDRAAMRRAALRFGQLHSLDASAFDDNVRLFADAMNRRRGSGT